MSRSASAKARPLAEQDRPPGERGAPDAKATPTADEPLTEPCLHCGHPVAVRLMGCKGGHCPNCRHPYPHGDCSD